MSTRKCLFEIYGQWARVLRSFACPDQGVNGQTTLKWMLHK